MICHKTTIEELLQRKNGVRIKEVIEITLIQNFINKRRNIIMLLYPINNSPLYPAVYFLLSCKFKNCITY